MKYKITLLVLCAMSLASCAHTPPTQGEKMLAVSSHTKMLSNQWAEGDKLVASGKHLQKKSSALTSEGEANINHGENQISEANAMNREGRKQIAKGVEIRQESENSFSDQYPAASVSKSE